MSKTKGIQIGEGFILTEENGYYKVTSVSKNFSMRVDNTLPFYGACKLAVTDVNFRATFHDMIMFFYFPASIQMNQEVYNKYVAFLSGIVEEIKGTPATDKEHDEALEDVKHQWQMKKESKETEEPKGTIYYRPHHGSFEESDKEKFVVKSLKDIEDFYKNEKEPRFLFIPTELKCEYYGEDARHETWFDTYIITAMVNGERAPLGFSNGMLK